MRKEMRNRLVVSVLSLFIVLLGQPKSEARFAEFSPIEDSSLRDHQKYQRWKRLLVGNQACQAIWSKWADVSLMVHITMASAGSRAEAGAETKDFLFDDTGALREVTIELGSAFAVRAPRNAAAYPVLSALAGDGYIINGEVRAIAFLSHEFGHVELARIIGGEVYQRQNMLLRKSEAGFKRYGWDWFDMREYKGIVADLGATPFDVVRGREVRAEAVVIPVLQEYFGKKMPANVREAIESYEPSS